MELKNTELSETLQNMCVCDNFCLKLNVNCRCLCHRATLPCKILRVKWCGNTNTKPFIYLLEQSEKSWDIIKSILADSESVYTIEDNHVLQENEISSNFNNDVVSFYFGLNIHY